MSTPNVTSVKRTHIAGIPATGLREQRAPVGRAPIHSGNSYQTATNYRIQSGLPAAALNASAARFGAPRPSLTLSQAKVDDALFNGVRGDAGRGRGVVVLADALKAALTA